MRNEQVVRNWVAGKPAKAGNLRTDGVSLWSYALMIGDTMLSGKKVVHDYSISQTTTRHINMAKKSI